MRRRRDGIGAGFGRLWMASTAGNFGDGIGRVAIALLAAQLTRDPLAIAAITVLSYLPWLVFGMAAGALVDRHDRRRLAVLAGAVRTAAIALLTLGSATGHASLWLLYAVVVLLYTCETVYDSAVIAMVPTVVSKRADLERANGRLQGAQLVAESFVGPPLAGAVFALAAAYAFGIHAACYVVAALLLLTMPTAYRPRPEQISPAAPRAAMHREVADGLRYLRGHRLHRMLLGFMVAIFFGSAMVNAITVLWTLDVLGVSERFYGVFLLTLAGGALGGSQTAPALARRAGRGLALRIAVMVAGVGGLIAAASTSPYVAGVGLALVGWASVTFNVINVSLRQRITPPTILGRVTGTYRAAVTSVMVAGAVAGGVLASIGGLRLPIVIFGLWCVILAVLMRTQLTNDVIDHAVADADAAAVEQLG